MSKHKSILNKLIQLRKTLEKHQPAMEHINRHKEVYLRNQLALENINKNIKQLGNLSLNPSEQFMRDLETYSSSAFESVTLTF